VLNVPGALAVVGGTGGEPAAVPDLAIEALRAGLSERIVEPHPLLRVGQLARVRSGAFAGMQGVVVRKKNGFRVVLTLELIMQSIAVEMSERDLEPVGVRAPNEDSTADLELGLCFQGV
jgi:transcription antitermination factor NusG